MRGCRPRLKGAFLCVANKGTPPNSPRAANGVHREPGRGAGPELAALRLRASGVRAGAPEARGASSAVPWPAAPARLLPGLRARRGPLGAACWAPGAGAGAAGLGREPGGQSWKRAKPNAPPPALSLPRAPAPSRGLLAPSCRSSCLPVTSGPDRLTQLAGSWGWRRRGSGGARERTPCTSAHGNTPWERPGACLCPRLQSQLDRGLEPGRPFRQTLLACGGARASAPASGGPGPSRAQLTPCGAGRLRAVALPPGGCAERARSGPKLPPRARRTEAEAEAAGVRFPSPSAGMHCAPAAASVCCPGRPLRHPVPAGGGGSPGEDQAGVLV